MNKRSLQFHAISKTECLFLTYPANYQSLGVGYGLKKKHRLQFIIVCLMGLKSLASLLGWYQQMSLKGEILLGKKPNYILIGLSTNSITCV
jgi:hypothetical protein